jgi:hypothetical protein
MGADKDQKQQTEDNRGYFPKCEICGAPIDGDTDGLCYGCSKEMLNNDD